VRLSAPFSKQIAGFSAGAGQRGNRGLPLSPESGGARPQNLFRLAGDLVFDNVIGGVWS
jgi:hypothetical protein